MSLRARIAGALLFLVGFVLSACEQMRGYKWGYRVCHKQTSDCQPYSAIFKNKDNCIWHSEKSGHRCLGGKYLQSARVDDPVCWKEDSPISRSECNEL